MITIENKNFKASFDEVGAQLMSLVSRADGKEYIWQRDPAFWASCAPVLFPICGRWVDNTYYENGKAYEMKSHGFLRKTAAKEVKNHGDRAECLFYEDEKTLAEYPYPFRLEQRLSLIGTGLNTEIVITNTGSAEMPFQVGAHPAFNLDLAEGKTLSDYSIVFPEAQDEVRTAIFSDGGYTTGKTAPFPLTDKTRRLSEETLVSTGVFLLGAGNSAELHCEGADRFIRVAANRSACYGLWKVNDPACRFLALEPWCGFPDLENGDHTFATRPETLRLAPGESFTFSYRIEILSER